MVMVNKLKFVVGLVLVQALIATDVYALSTQDIEGKFYLGVVSTVIYSIVGIVMAVVSFKVLDAIIPGDLKKQLTEDRNVAIGIVVGLQALGISIIIAAAIAG